MEIRLAEKSDLSTLEAMFDDIIKTMNKNGIFIWNKYYPFEEYEHNIQKGRLYILTDNQNIVSVFALTTVIQGGDCFSWQNNNAKAMYIARLGVNTNYTHKGFGSKTLQKAMQICKQKNIDYLRLTVAEENTPAINLYLKNNFTKVNGLFQKYSESLSKTINEIGFEIQIK